MEMKPYMVDPSYVSDLEQCDEETLRCSDMVVGMAYVPMQVWGNITEPAEAICRGTQFPDLDKPFFGEDIWA